MDTHTISDAPDFSIATVPPTARERQLSLIIAATVLAATEIISAFGDTQLQQIDGFIPAIEFVIWLVTLKVCGIRLIMFNVNTNMNSVNTNGKNFIPSVPAVL